MGDTDHSHDLMGDTDRSHDLMGDILLQCGILNMKN